MIKSEQAHKAVQNKIVNREKQRLFEKDYLHMMRLLSCQLALKLARENHIK
ncbi:MAG: hypothetical protein LKM44_02275 [Wolbachia endosymbiont of Meromenopon meropis]|nr:hypothetical protein [Wolbachia endosymbiont of Meromenopon meropis]